MKAYTLPFCFWLDVEMHREKLKMNRKVRRLGSLDEAKIRKQSIYPELVGFCFHADFHFPTQVLYMKQCHDYPRGDTFVM